MPVYCITGANRGLGLEFVRQLAASPENTILATSRSVSPPDLSDLKAAASATTHIIECDTSNPDSVRSFAQQAVGILAGKKVDFLINNAGVNLLSSRSSLQLDLDALLDQVRVNVAGPAKTVEFFLGEGILSADVRVVNLTSGLASMGVSLGINPRKCAGYSISKAGLNMLSVHQSGDLKATLPGAVVIVMDPGWVKTRLGGEGAILEPEESIGGMLKVIHGLGQGDNGKFFSYQGDEIPW